MMIQEGVDDKIDQNGPQVITRRKMQLMVKNVYSRKQQKQISSQNFQCVRIWRSYTDNLIFIFSCCEGDDGEMIDNYQSHLRFWSVRFWKWFSMIWKWVGTTISRHVWKWFQSNGQSNIRSSVKLLNKGEKIRLIIKLIDFQSRWKPIEFKRKANTWKDSR